MNTNLSRRSFLGASAIGLASVAYPFSGFARLKKPKNIIFMVSDGMSAGVPSMVDHYLQLTAGKASFWRQLMENPEATHGLQDTRSLNSVVTDSAAASSAWGSGRHVWNGSINMYPDGTVLRPIFNVLAEHKMKRGLVSTTTITDATPAGFATSIMSRGDQHIIAENYLKDEIDVILGGGGQFFSSDSRKDKRDLTDDYAKQGYRIVKNRSEMDSAESGKLLGLFASGSMPYYVDRLNVPDYSSLPTLEQMSMAAINQLKGSSEGFILQIEAARVDHGAHANDLAALLLDQLEFDNAVQRVVEWALKDGETLVVITTDHANSNPGLDGQGDEYWDSTAGLLSLTKMKRSYESMLSAFGSSKSYGEVQKGEALDPTVPNVQGLIEKQLGVKLTNDEAQLVVDGITGKSPLKVVKQYDIPSSSLALALNNHTCVGWTGRQHTDDFVLVSAVGPGREMFSGFNANVSFHEKLLALRGIKAENPVQMSKEDAVKAMDKKKRSALSEAVSHHWA